MKIEQLAYNIGLAHGKFQRIIDFCVDQDSYTEECKEIDFLLQECGKIICESSKAPPTKLKTMEEFEIEYKLNEESETQSLLKSLRADTTETCSKK